jgi:hypothetical protein
MGVGPGYRSMLHGLYRGVSWQTKEQLNLGRPEGSVKAGRRESAGGELRRRERHARRELRAGQSSCRSSWAKPSRRSRPCLHNLQSGTGSPLEDAR